MLIVYSYFLFWCGKGSYKYNYILYSTAHSTILEVQCNIINIIANLNLHSALFYIIRPGLQVQYLHVCLLTYNIIMIYIIIII